MEAYRSIPCIDPERLEFAVLRRQRLRIEWRDEADELRAEVVLPTDVATRDGAEWLSYRLGDGPIQTLRLDRIATFSPA